MILQELFFWPLMTAFLKERGWVGQEEEGVEVGVE